MVGHSLQVSNRQPDADADADWFRTTDVAFLSHGLRFFAGLISRDIAGAGGKQLEFGTTRSTVCGAMLLALLLASAAHAESVKERRNYFNDPFLQVTGAITDCPVPQGPLYSEEEARAEGHHRAEAGTRCHQSGRCRLPNSYLYDKEIIPRVKKAIDADKRFSNTSIWIEGQRRWVWLKGCVRNKKDSVAIERLVRKIEDVDAVINQLTVLSQ